MRTIKTLIEQQGLPATVRNVDAAKYDQLMTQIAENGPSKGATAMMNVVPGSWEESERYIGHIYMGGFSSGNWLMIWFQHSTYPRHKINVNWSWQAFDPTTCRFYDECTCDDNHDDDDEWGEDCAYCEHGSDYCINHNDYHE